MLIVLKLGAYGIFFQDKVPDYAQVAETVQLVKKIFGQKLANVANGALRQLARNQAAALSDEILTTGGATKNIPDSIFSLWAHDYGLEVAQKLAQRSVSRPWPAVRLNPLHPAYPALQNFFYSFPYAEKAGNSGIAAPPGKMPPQINGHALEYWLRQGALSRQGAGSQEVLAKLELPEKWQNAPIWDACVGFGGKSACLLEQGLNVALASDTSMKRIKRLPQECARLGVPIPHAMLADAANAPLNAWDGHILADAPCSGLGVLAKRPDLILRFDEKKVAQLVSLQARILNALGAILKPGRELVYVTCTLNPAENERQIEAFLANNRNMELLCVWRTPHDHPWLEGMYGARLLKTV